jgi:hypothetical protein
MQFSSNLVARTEAEPMNLSLLSYHLPSPSLLLKIGAQNDSDIKDHLPAWVNVSHMLGLLPSSSVAPSYYAHIYAQQNNEVKHGTSKYVPAKLKLSCVLVPDKLMCRPQRRRPWGNPAWWSWELELPSRPAMAPQEAAAATPGGGRACSCSCRDQSA